MAKCHAYRLSPSAAAYLPPGVKVIDTHLFGLYGDSGGKHMAETLEAFCYTCQTTVEVHGYWHGEWDLVEPPDADAPDHHDHDVSIEGRA